MPAGKAGFGLIDTGATFTCVHQPVMAELGLSPVSVATMGTANGPAEQPVYPARLVFPETGWDFDVQGLAGVNLTGQAIDFGDGKPPQPILALLGRDLLQTCVLVWNGPAAMWSISY